MKKRISCAALVCMVVSATVFLCFPETKEAFCETEPQELQILFIGNTKGLLEPCG